MVGTLASAWSYSWIDVWGPLDADSAAPPELFMELYPELTKALVEPPRHLNVISEEDHLVSSPTDTEFLNLSSDPELARAKFQKPTSHSIKSEVALCRFIEEAHPVIEDLDDKLAIRYTELIHSFITRYNLRYKLVAPFQLVPSIPGLLATFADEVARIAESHEHLQDLRMQFERSMQVLCKDGDAHDIQRCIGSACNLTEGLARSFPGAKAETLGALAKELKIWPHATMEQALAKLYGFCSDYPSIRHSGSRGSVLRALDTKDALLVSALLLVFGGYFVDLNMNEIMGTRAAR